MRARFFCQVGKLKGERFEFAEEATIGRHPDNSIVLSPASLSSHHARILYDSAASCYVLEDLASMNGTRLDGHRVTASEPLGHLHVITFAGKHDFIFQDLERCAVRHPPTAGAPRRAPSSPFSAAGRPRDKTVIETDPAALPASFGSPLRSSDTPAVEHTRYEELPVPLPAGFGRLPKRGSEEKTRMEQLPPALPAALVRPGVKLPGVKPPGVDDEAPAAVDRPFVMAVDNLDDAVENLVSRQQARGAESREASRVEEGMFFLELLTQGGTTLVQLSEGENLVGRDPTARVRPENPDISRRHATLTVSRGRVTVRDEGSRNHTFLAGEEVEGEMEVWPGAQLRFGSAKALLVLETRRPDGDK